VLTRALQRARVPLKFEITPAQNAAVLNAALWIDDLIEIGGMNDAEAGASRTA
jgi:hypothetical protein